VERQVSVAFDFNGMHFDEGGGSSMRSLGNSSHAKTRREGGSSMRSLGNSSHAKTRRREGGLVDAIIGEQLSREAAKARREGAFGCDH